MDCNPPGSSVCGIFQARILESIAVSFSRDLPNPGINCIGRWVLYHRTTWEAPLATVGSTFSNLPEKQKPHGSAVAWSLGESVGVSILSKDLPPPPTQLIVECYDL